jgi:hypothetical protein
VNSGSYGVSGYFGRLYIYSNIMHTSSSRGISVGSYITDADIRNNIIGNTRTAVYTYDLFAGTVSIRYNYLWNVTDAGDLSTDPADSNLFENIDPADPQYVADPQVTGYSDANDFTNDDYTLDAGDPDANYDDTDCTRNDIGAYGGPDGAW